ncbi:uncharacterized protein [Epargyreus clarus]|uniref:uncharacterized protein n=1 Tax=Epargyreus clarus TaxID=520877 RepID=UPI003C2D86A4
MISSKNRVQAIKSKFENLNVEHESVAKKNNITAKQLCVQEVDYPEKLKGNKDNEIGNFTKNTSSHDKYNPAENTIQCPKPNSSYLHGKNDLKSCDSKTSLTRQSSDPGKKLHRSHAFRCDRSQKINHSPKRHGSCNGRSETSDFSYKMGERKLTKERLKLLGDFIEEQMKKDKFPVTVDAVIVGQVRDVRERVSIPDSEVPKHILDQYAKVVKTKSTEKQDAMTDSGVSSETENLEDEKTSKFKQLVAQYEKSEPSDTSRETLSIKSDDIPKIPKEINKSEISEANESVSNNESSDTTDSNTNLANMNDLCASSETMRLEKKNPHLKLTDTLKKALKQPLPAGPPPKKPPRTFGVIPESPKQRKDPRKMLEKLEQVLEKREAEKSKHNSHTESKERKPKEMHYLCTEILDIAQRTLPIQSNLDPFSKCLNSLNCAIVTNNSMSSLPYTRLNSDPNSIGNSCSCSNDCLDIKNSTFNEERCNKCKSNEKEGGFICHLNCKCKASRSEFFVKEHIYDVPCFEGSDGNDRSQYGTLNSLQTSKSMDDLRSHKIVAEDQVYDVPCEDSPPSSPKLPKSEFQKLRENFEKSQNTDYQKLEKLDSVKSQKPENPKIGNTLKAIDNVNKIEKPTTLPPKPILVTKSKWKSTENLSEEFKTARSHMEKKFSTDVRPYRKFKKEGRRCGLSLPKDQLDVDKENLNRLMTEIYETVTAACNMDDHKPSSFPTEQSDGSTSEESIKLTRSLTENRKNYVRRVSSRVAYLDQRNLKSLRFRHQTSICSYKSEIIDNPYSTFRSWKSFRTSQSNLRDKMDRTDSTDSKFNLTDSTGNVLSMKDDFADNSMDSLDDLSIDEKTGCVDISLPFEPRERGLFNVCLLVGLNYMTGEAYVKSVFPSQVQVPPHIENLIFPETISSESKEECVVSGKGAQCYSLVLTDELGERSYGYCRRVIPEGGTTCLPLCYCLIGKYRAPGFYYKILQEIESHHGDSEIEINQILQQLFEMDFPNPGEQITITYTSKNVEEFSKISKNLSNLAKCKTLPDQRRLDSRTEVNVCVKKETLSDVTESVSDKSEKSDRPDEVSDAHELPEFYDVENNNSPKSVLINVEGPRTHTIKRPLEPRVDDDDMSTLLDAFGAGLLIKVFSSLLLERKVVVVGDELSTVSACLSALQASLYPLVWQQPLISCVPRAIRRDVLLAPLPILAAALASPATRADTFEEGMLIDLTLPNKVQCLQGDESTILPTTSFKTLKTSLQMESLKNKDRQIEDTKTRNVLISEAFLRFFVDILGDFWKYFSSGEVKHGDLGKNGVVFDKEAFIKNATSKQNQFFLEWFTETAMFNHFIQNMAIYHTHHSSDSSDSSVSSVPDSELVDTPLPNFYELFLERSRSRPRAGQKGAESKLSYRNAMNRKVKLLKTKLRDLVA